MTSPNQTSGAQSTPQRGADDAPPNRDSQSTVPVYVPLQGQGPDYVHKGANGGKS